MRDSISSETREQLEALCRKISVSYDQDPEIRKELYGHMEDRLLAHMNGEIPLTEQDAFILVREHFGDPALVKESFQGVHLEQAALSMGRRLAAVFVACTAANCLSTFLQLSTSLVPSFFGAWREPIQMGLFTLIEVIFIPWIMWRILFVWKRRMDSGEGVWFQTMPGWGVAAALGATLWLLIAGIFFYKYVESFAPNPVSGDDLGPLTVLAALASMVAMGAIWIWFCDQPPRTWKGLLLATGIWAGVLQLIMVIGAFTVAPDDAVPTLSDGLMRFIFFLGLLFSCVMAITSLGVYRLGARLRRRPTSR